MKTVTFVLLSLCLSIPLLAQEEPTAPKFQQEELDKLVAPIALYPDSLVALILPASTTSSDVVLAARYLDSDGDQAAIDNQPWSDSVKSLAHFPALVKWMDENLAWTRQMGEVFEAQPADVMNAIQRLRAQARQAGLLTDTPQQKIVMQDAEIYIVPAEPNIIYVPRYDPEILWTRRSYSGDFMTFGVGFGIGSWLYYDCDWRDRAIWVQHRNPGWVYHPGWRRPERGAQGFVGAPWHPDPRRIHPMRPQYGQMPVAVRPRGMDAPHQDFHGRNENITTQHGGRPDRFGPVATPGSSEHSQHAVAPPPPAFRAHQAVGPQPQPQRERREGENRSSPQPPHPPSHAPIMSPTPRSSAPAPAVVRPSAPQPAAVQSSGHRSEPPAKSSSDNDADNKQWRRNR